MIFAQVAYPFPPSAAPAGAAAGLGVLIVFALIAFLLWVGSIAIALWIAYRVIRAGVRDGIRDVARPVGPPIAAVTSSAFPVGPSPRKPGEDAAAALDRLTSSR